MARPALSHVGIYVHDQDRMVAFYEAALGLVVSDIGHGNLFPVRLVFMTGDPAQHHQLVLASGRAAPDDAPTTVNQLSFKVADLGELRATQMRAVAAGARDLSPINHGNALSLYMRDPEGNPIEIDMDTDWYLPQPHRGELDFDLDDGEILQRTEAMARSDPGFKTRKEWEAAIREKLAALQVSNFRLVRGARLFEWLLV